MTSAELAHLLALRAHLAEHLDPSTAEIQQFLVPVNDPYCDFAQVPGDKTEQWMFARSPGNDHWLLISDLPEAARRALHARIEAEHLAERPRPLPAGDV